MLGTLAPGLKGIEHMHHCNTGMIHLKMKGMLSLCITSFLVKSADDRHREHGSVRLVNDNAWTPLQGVHDGAVQHAPGHVAMPCHLQQDHRPELTVASHASRTA